MFKQLQDMALFALVSRDKAALPRRQKAELPKSSQRISQLEQQVGISSVESHHAQNKPDVCGRTLSGALS